METMPTCRESGWEEKVPRSLHPPAPHSGEEHGAPPWPLHFKFIYRRVSILVNICEGQKKNLFHRKKHGKIKVRSKRKAEEVAPWMWISWTREIVNNSKMSQRPKKAKQTNSQFSKIEQQVFPLWGEKVIELFYFKLKLKGATCRK